MSWEGIKMVDRKFSEFKISWIPIILKSIVIAISLAYNLFIRKAICPLVLIWWSDPFRTGQKIHLIHHQPDLHEGHPIHAGIFQILIWHFHLLLQRVLYLWGSTPKITLKSGFIGIGTHKSIVDFLYYSYILNPVFVRLVIFKKEDK